MCPFATVTLDATLRFQPLNELLRGGELGGRDFFIKDISNFFAGRLPALPQHLQDGKFGVGNLVQFHGNRSSVLSEDSLSDLHNIGSWKCCQWACKKSFSNAIEGSLIGCPWQEARSKMVPALANMPLRFLVGSVADSLTDESGG